LEHGKASFLNLQFEVEFGNLKFYFTGPGPPVSGPRRFTTARSSDRTHAAHHRLGHRAVTTLTAESTLALVTTVAHVGAALSSAKGGGLSPLSLPPPMLLLPLALHSASLVPAT
jgi:hypothetical protein